MKLAVFGDVHGNLAALEATLEDAERQAATASYVWVMWQVSGRNRVKR